MGAALGKNTNAEPVVPSKEEAVLPKIFLRETTPRADDDSSSSALIHAADEEPSEHFGNAEEALQISTDSTAWGGASKMLCCFTSGGSQFQPLGSPKLGSMLWQSTNGFNFLGRSLSGALLPPMAPHLAGRLTVVLDLDETLVHSSFVPVTAADFLASVPVEGEPTDVWVYKRPHLDYFMRQVAAHFEVVIFTASLATYADVVLDIIDDSSLHHDGNSPGTEEEACHSGALTCVPVVPGHTQAGLTTGPAALDKQQASSQHSPDPLDSSGSRYSSDRNSTMHHRLYRGSCVRVSGSYIKDLSRLGRSLNRTVIVDNSPASYMWNPDSAIPSVNFIDDKTDDGLLKILDVLMRLKDSQDVRTDLPYVRSAAGYHVPMC